MVHRRGGSKRCIRSSRAVLHANLGIVGYADGVTEFGRTFVSINTGST